MHSNGKSAVKDGIDPLTDAAPSVIDDPAAPDRAAILHKRLKEARDLRAALDEHAVVVITDSEGKIIFVNNRFREITSYTEEELLGVDFRLIKSGYHPEPFFKNLWATISSGRTWRGEIKNRTKDGSDFWATTTIVPFIGEDGAPRHYVAIYTDITKQKRLEAELEGKLRLQRLLADLSARFAGLTSEHVDAAIQNTQQLIVETLGLDRSTLWQIDEEGRGLRLTHCWQRPGWPPLPRVDHAETILPWSYAKVISGEGFSFTSINDLPAEANQDAALFRIHGPKSNVTVPLVANGHVFGAIAFASLGHEHPWSADEVSDLKLVAQIISNVVGRQRAEMRSEQLRAEIAHSARSAMLGELTAALAHELNQPLAAILSNSQAARRFLAAGTMDLVELESILSDVERDSKRAGGVVHNLRKMLGKAESDRESCDVGGIICEVAELMHGELIAQKIDLTHAIAEGLPPVEAARVELQQILMNLLLNAMQAMVDTSEGMRRVEIHAVLDGRMVAISVRDNGHGIPSKQLTRIFEPFYTTKPAGIGMGMGLAICRRFVESHRGRITAYNNEDEGATFTFSLPAHLAG